MIVIYGCWKIVIPPSKKEKKVFHWPPFPRSQIFLTFYDKNRGEIVKNQIYNAV